jgi:hypothetical protein
MGYALSVGRLRPSQLLPFNRRPVAVVAETYSAADFEDLRDLAAERGLAMHSPVDPRAGFWAPGLASLAVLTSKGFGPIRWLPHQRSRPGTPARLAIQGYTLDFRAAARA